MFSYFLDIDGERRSFALLRPVTTSPDIRDLILQVYAEQAEEEDRAAASQHQI